MQSLPTAVRKHTGESAGGGDDGDPPPHDAAPDKGFGATMKRLRQSAKAKMAELNERRLHGVCACGWVYEWVYEWVYGWVSGCGWVGI